MRDDIMLYYARGYVVVLAIFYVYLSKPPETRCDMAF